METPLGWVVGLGAGTAQHPQRSVIQELEWKRSPWGLAEESHLACGVPPVERSVQGSAPAHCRARLALSWLFLITSGHRPLLHNFYE